MLRKRLAASVAAAPLLLFAHGALAETVISGALTTGVATATAGTGGVPDDVRVSSTGSIKPTTAGSTAITLNSNNTVTNEGALATSGLDNTTGILVVGGNTGSVLNKLSITLDETYTETDSDSDGDADNPLATGSGRYGIRVTGPFTGPISNVAGATISIRGNNSAGISIEGAYTGNLTSTGTVSVTGANSYGVHVAAPVTGNIRIESTASAGGVSVTGKGSTAVAIDGDVTGKVTIQGAVGATGYRTATRPTTSALRAKLDLDDGVDQNLADGFDPTLFGGPAVRIAGNVSGGVLLDTAPTISTSTTLDGDGDGVLDSADTDQDQDGATDTEEGSSALIVTGGSPALLIGSDSQSVTLGAVAGSGANNYGLVTQGSIIAAGLMDGVSSTAIQIGGSTGQDTILTNGARIASAITFSAFEGNTTGIRLTDGAQVNTLLVQGALSGTAFSDGKVAATLGANGRNAATGILVENGATVGTIRNSGVMTIVGQGEKVDAVGIRDLGNTVTLIENTGRILTGVAATDDVDDTTDSDNDASNEVAEGKSTAIDVSTSTVGVTVRQTGPAAHVSTDTTDVDKDGVYDADESAMVGAILLGSGADRLEVLNGNVLASDIRFGDGADVLLINGPASTDPTISSTTLVIAALHDSDGALDIQLQRGSLTITNAENIAATSLTTANNSSLTFTADPGTSSATRLNVVDANIGAGTKIGVRFTSLLTGDVRYTVIKASNSLTAGALDQSLLGNSPYLYVASASADTAAGEVYLDVRRRTAAEIGLNAEGTAAYNAVYQALFGDTGIRDAFLAQNTKNGFLAQFDQMLPNQNEGIFSALQMAGQTVTDVIASRPDPHQRYGPDSFWLQEFNTRIQRDTGSTEGSDTKAFGFIAGYESMGDGGALGATLSYVNAEEKGSSAMVGEQSTASLFEAGVYWRGYAGNFRYGVRGGVGYTRLESDRRFIYVTDTDSDGVADTTALDRQNHSKWNGFTASAGVDIAYEARMGRFYARPSAGIDYLYLSEDGHAETGGGAGFDLNYDSRTSSRLTAEAMLALGAEFGRDSWWRPEVRLGYRARLAGQLGDSVVRFSGGTPFTIAGSDSSTGALVLGFSVRAGTPMSYLALEGDSELSDEEMRYLLRIVGRVMF